MFLNNSQFSYSKLTTKDKCFFLAEFSKDFKKHRWLVRKKSLSSDKYQASNSDQNYLGGLLELHLMF